jgi:hypothetical protein
MLLGLAVVLIGFQMTPTTIPTLVSPAAGVTPSAKTAEESDSTLPVANHLKVDSIYATDKERQPVLVPVGVAQNSQSFSTIRIPDVNEQRYAHREAESKPLRREWLALAIMEHGAAAFDAYSTRQAISRGAAEEDPIMRPFAHSPAIYAAIQVGPVLLDVLARRMQRSPYGFVRRTWWVPQSVSTGMSVFSGVHNLSVVGHP